MGQAAPILHRSDSIKVTAAELYETALFNRMN